MDWMKIGKIVLGVLTAVTAVAAGNEVTRAIHKKSDQAAFKKTLDDAAMNIGIEVRKGMEEGGRSISEQIKAAVGK